MQRATPKRLIDARELGQLLSVKVSTIYKWTFEGRIPHYKIGRLVRFDPQEVWEWASKCKWQKSSGRLDRL